MAVFLIKVRSWSGSGCSFGSLANCSIRNLSSLGRSTSLSSWTGSSSFRTYSSRSAPQSCWFSLQNILRKLSTGSKHLTCLKWIFQVFFPADWEEFRVECCLMSCHGLGEGFRTIFYELSYSKRQGRKSFLTGWAFPKLRLCCLLRSWISFFPYCLTMISKETAKEGWAICRWDFNQFFRRVSGWWTLQVRIQRSFSLTGWDWDNIHRT